MKTPDKIHHTFIKLFWLSESSKTVGGEAFVLIEECAPVELPNRPLAPRDWTVEFPFYEIGSKFRELGTDAN